MTDSDDLTPAQAQHVRRALADARHNELMPADVVARLDAVLAELADEQRSTDRTGTTGPAALVEPAATVDLAARRRRRNGAGLVLAAAAVVVAGVGLGSLTQGWGPGAGSDQEATTLSEADGASAAEESATASPPAGATPYAESRNLEEPLSDDRSAAKSAGRPHVRPAHFAADVQLLATQLALPKQLAAESDAAAPTVPQDAGVLAPPHPGCGPQPGTGEVLLGVTWRGEPAHLLLGAEADGGRTAELHTCDPQRLVRRTTVAVD